MKKRPMNHMSEQETEFCKLVRANAHRHRVYDVFRDFCELSALSLSNAVDRLHYDRRQARYLEIVGKYEKEEIKRFSQMLACVVEELSRGMRDCLGRLFMGLELGDSGKGQFFTPYEVSRLMASISMTGAAEVVKKHGFITLSEPACGAGGMVIAAADALLDAGINYQQSMHVVAIDIDPTACHMAYIQMALLGIPGVVVHGNALLVESWDEWVTPFHVLGRWDERLAQRAAIDKLRQLMAGPAGGDEATAEAAPTQHPAGPALVTFEQIRSKRHEQAEQMALF